ncbi:AAA family ATPase [Streptococcus gallolyticus]|nr:AAA family ATPase [Streptococcus gallolyticus]MBY5040962.1 AAA family ATPase [Streptococcus gallolyticus]
MIEEEKQLGVKNKYVNYLEKSYNLIFRGAPGTGKTYLAKQIAATIVTDGRVDTYAELSDEEKSRIGFVQFHPSYDYTDFVEGLRPTPSVGGNIGFELKDGVFKGFCDRARKNVGIGGQDNFEQAWDNYLDFVNTSEEKEYLTKTSYLTVNSRQNFSVNYDSGASGWTLPRQYVYKLYKNRNYDEQSYYKSGGKTVLETLKIRFGLEDYKAPTDLKTDCKFVFIIDEINRGEISKIFGELFFSLDPGYRGEEGAVLTQYANLHEDPEEKFYIPENVYIIGTMNDIDRSVDTFDFAMRRRFRFIEITADERTEMLEGLGDKKEEAISRMTSLNQAISEVEGLNSHYHVGPAYFLKLKSMSFEELWTDQLEPLLEDYVRGSYKEDEIMAQLRKAYYRTPIGVDGDE